MKPACAHLQRLYVAAALAAVALALASCSRQQHQATPAPQPQKPKPAPARPRFARPEHVRGIYMTAWSAGSKRMLAQLLAYVKRNGLNSVVIDIRDSGEIYFKTGIPLAATAKATKVAVVHPERLIAALEKAGVYPIARIACFRDSFLPLKRPDRAVVLADGRLWKDRTRHTWLDPYNRMNWDYLAQVVDYALDLGFPEIQLDYVRFPSEGKKATMLFPSKKLYADPKAPPSAVISAFAASIRDRVKARGAAFSADIFGIVSSSKSDEGIGQELETVAAPFDLISPMVYPSHFHKGEYGIRDPNASPYRIISKSLRDYVKRLPGKPIRPWLQCFGGYGSKQLGLQIKAVRDVGFQEYLLWNAANRYVDLPALPRAKPKP